MHFCFFAQIALLRADAAVGFADIASPQDSTIAHAQGQGLDGTSSWEATPRVLRRRHDVRSVTSADTDQLGYKTKVHLQRPFSGLGSTFFGRTLMHFCFFVQIALLRADAAVGFADIASPQDSTIAHARGQGLDGTSSWEATPQVLCRRHDVRTFSVALKLPRAFPLHAVARSVALAFMRLELFFTAAERQPCSSPNCSEGRSLLSIITAAPSNIWAQQVERRVRCVLPGRRQLGVVVVGPSMRGVVGGVKVHNLLQNGPIGESPLPTGTLAAYASSRSKSLRQSTRKTTKIFCLSGSPKTPDCSALRQLASPRCNDGESFIGGLCCVAFGRYYLMRADILLQCVERLCQRHWEH
ncbi:hypothetical protein MRX96_020076 [Rhipicephalus microplus]